MAMPLLDAIYKTAHEHPGGVEALAARMGVNAQVLRNKVNPNAASHHLTAREADLMMALTGDFGVLHALAANHGFVCVKAPDDVSAGDLAVLDIITLIWARTGDVGRAVYETLADGRVEKHELSNVRQLAYTLQQGLIEMLGRLESMAD
ncbi:phage regulatory CII family protein [Andreprevotia chitinilytica]|uniref:phage regulatory CII family protein n=1 Tax=Andreprevotia chitinilytica TaxID=396808 RepID=UPI000689944A|nr:phage regulatory CII family protein [Andreprevotia chitinilytica]